MPVPSSSRQRYGGDPETIYLTMRGDLQKVLMLPLEGERALFRDFLVGYLMVEHNYSEARAVSLVAGYLLLSAIPFPLFVQAARMYQAFHVPATRWSVLVTDGQSRQKPEVPAQGRAVYCWVR